VISRFRKDALVFSTSMKKRQAQLHATEWLADTGEKPDFDHSAPIILCLYGAVHGNANSRFLQPQGRLPSQWAQC
jgi:hypothetical protein